MPFKYPSTYRELTERHKSFEYLSAQDRAHVSCELCKDILLEPYQTHCGCRFCRNCLGKCKDICPGCLKTIDPIHRNESFADKATEKEIMELKIHCLNGSCEYICKLRYLNDHIQLCHSNIGEYSQIVCPYQCNEKVQDNINMHLDKCKRMIVECPMTDVGSEKILPREEMDDHARDDVNYPMSLMMVELVEITKDNESIREKYSLEKHRLDKEIKDLKKSIVGNQMKINEMIMKLLALKKSLRDKSQLSWSHKYKFTNARRKIKLASIIFSPMVSFLIDSATLPGYILSFNLSLTDHHETICLSMTVRRSDGNYQEPSLLKMVGIKWKRFDSVAQNHWCDISDLPQRHTSKAIELNMSTDTFLLQNSFKDNLSFIVEILDVPVMDEC